MAASTHSVQGQAIPPASLTATRGAPVRGLSSSQDATSQPEHPTGGVNVEGTNLTGQLPLAFPKRRPQRPYWATTVLTREQMAGAIRVAEQQDEAVIAIFRGMGTPLSPSQVWRIGQEGGRQWLLTSVRRSITNLADPKCGALVRLHETVQGPYGRPEGLWSLPARARAA